MKPRLDKSLGPVTPHNSVNQNIMLNSFACCWKVKNASHTSEIQNQKKFLPSQLALSRFQLFSCTHSTVQNGTCSNLVLLEPCYLACTGLFDATVVKQVVGLS